MKQDENLWLYRRCHSRGSVHYSGQRGRLRERPEPRLSIEFATRSVSASQGTVRQTTRRADEKLYGQTSVPKYIAPYRYQPLPAAAGYVATSRPVPSSVPPCPDPLHRLAAHAAQPSAPPERQTEAKPISANRDDRSIYKEI